MSETTDQEAMRAFARELFTPNPDTEDDTTEIFTDRIFNPTQSKDTTE